MLLSYWLETVAGLLLEVTLVVPSRPTFAFSKWRSEIELQSKLNQPRIVAGRGDSTEITGVGDSPVRIDAATRRGESIGVADRVGKVDMLEEIEELCGRLVPQRRLFHSTSAPRVGRT